MGQNISIKEKVFEGNFYKGVNELNGIDVSVQVTRLLLYFPL